MEHSQEQDGLKQEKLSLRIRKNKSFCKVCRRFECKDNCLQQLKDFNEGFLLTPKTKIKFFMLLLAKLPFFLSLIMLFNIFLPEFHEFFFDIMVDILEYIGNLFFTVVFLFLKFWGINKREEAENFVLASDSDLILISKFLFAIYVGLIFFGIFVSLFDVEIKIFNNYLKRRGFKKKGYSFDYSLYSEPLQE